MRSSSAPVSAACALTLRLLPLALLGASGAWAAAAPRAPSNAPPNACAYLTLRMRSQPGDALFLASYPQAGPGPLQQVAFLYDNAVAAIALVACGQLEQGRRIGEAMVRALEHDRYWHDGRLRNGYAAGAVGPGPLRLAGWWDARAGRWLEDDYQAGSDSGNLAWAMLALLTLDDAHADPRWPEAAVRLAQWLERQGDARGAGGFTGGSFGSETSPRRLEWKSTEHNVDLAAAFARLAGATADARWLRASRAASRFVDAMWDGAGGAFATGTLADGLTRNPLLALDAQIWPLLALPGAAARYPAALARGAQRLRAGPGEEAGYAYSEAGGGSWTEGTAQVRLLQQMLQPGASARTGTAALAAARLASGGYYATTEAALPTGFRLDTDPAQPRLYLHLEHLGAAAWVALSERGFNPFTGTHALPRD